MKTTLKDVARDAGVSVATVSQALGGKGRIAEDTQKRIFDAAKRLGYRIRSIPPREAIEGRNTVGILLLVDSKWSFLWGFIRPIIDSIEGSLRERGYATIIIPIKADRSTRDILQSILVSGVRAVFSIHYGNEPLFEKLESFNIPVVVIMNNRYQDRFYSIGADDFQGAYEGTLYLIKLGHRTIAFVESERSEMPLLMSDRFTGFKKALDESSIPFLERNRIRFNSTNKDDLEAKLERIMKVNDAPTALFALDDDIGLHVFFILEKMGFSIPKDLSVICPGDVLDYLQPYVPKLTTMSIDTSYMGRLAADMMYNRLQGDFEYIHALKIKEQLTLRESCRFIGNTDVKGPHDMKFAHDKGIQY